MNSKKSLVIILGAGASADFGLPILSAVFKDTQAKAYIEQSRRLYTCLFDHFWRRQGLTLETSDKGANIEDIITILRDWEDHRKIYSPPLTVKDIHWLKTSLYKTVKAAVIDGKSSRGGHMNALIDWAEERFDDVTWASFNWDSIFEASYYYHRHRTNPKIVVPLSGWASSVSKSTLLKLHGSATWWQDLYALNYYGFASTDLNQKWNDLTPDSDAQPVILEPSFYKYRDKAYYLLEPQWRYLQDKLRTAYTVIVIGYSLPDGDSQAKSTILTAAIQNRKAPWLVVSPQAEEVATRFAKLVGAQRITPLSLTLAKLTASLPDSLNAPLCLPS